MGQSKRMKRAVICSEEAHEQAASSEPAPVPPVSISHPVNQTCTCRSVQSVQRTRPKQFPPPYLDMVNPVTEVPHS